MLKKGYIAIFAILLAVAGMGFVPTSVPNQEIVVQFAQSTSNNDSDAAIAQVRAKLAALGIENVQILELVDGSLKISYYSDIDVSHIQKSFARQKGGFYDSTSNNNNTDYPYSDNIDTYQFTVSEIGGGDADVYNGLKGHVLEIETKSHRFYPPEFFFATLSSSIKNEIKLTELSVRIYSQQTNVLAVTSRLLPETRAGPIG